MEISETQPELFGGALQIVIMYEFAHQRYRELRLFQVKFPGMQVKKNRQGSIAVSQYETLEQEKREKSKKKASAEREPATGD